MAGIILALGDTRTQHLEKIRQNYEFCKGLKASYEFLGNPCQLIKYKRQYDKEDNNYFESPDLVICAVGTVLYRNFGFENSIKQIGKTLGNGLNIKQIIDEIDGNFCLVIIHVKEAKVFIITDIGGVINTYLYTKHHMVFITTSMLALAKTFTVTPQLESILMFVRSGMFFNETTYFNEIQVLKPASVYQYDVESFQFTRNEYWSVPNEVNENISFKEARNRITKSLKHIIDHIPNDEAIYDFTGGYDSRFVLALAYGNGEKRRHLNAFFFGPPNSREAKIIEKSCMNLGLNYENYILPKDWDEKFLDYVLESNNLCDGMINACEYAPVLWVQKKKKENFNYSVLGLFGELYRGFTAKQEFIFAGRKRPANIQRYIDYRNLSGSFDPRIFSPIGSQFIRQIAKNLLDIYRQTNNKLSNSAPKTLQLDNIYFSHRMRRWGGRSVTTSNQFIRQICPLWFKKPLAISFSLPSKIKVREKLLRSITEEISPSLAREKTISGSPFVPINSSNLVLFFPAAIFYLLKAYRKFFEVIFKRNVMMGLTLPDYKIGEWYQRALQDVRCQDLLDHNKMISKCLYNKKRFNEFIEQPKGKEFHYYGQLGNIITVELTLRAANLDHKFIA